jgi:hypothetical protein
MLKTPQTDNDIKDLYVNIPIEETLTITKSMLLKRLTLNTTDNLLNETHSITELFHFQKQDIPARKRSIHGFTNLKYSSPYISTVPG